MTNLPSFEEIHVISDIHMGGKRGFQTLCQTERLANFIRWVAAQNPEKQVALILNGDVFDTLAEEDVIGYVAVSEAETVLNRIMNDDSFKPVWDALSAFVKTPNRTLVMVIGNHDIELAFPNIQRLIVEKLTLGDALAKSRIEFSASGAGYGCMVGKSRVFCTHGNEVDGWNINRYEGLSRVARRLNAGLTLNKEEWIPNAGTRMVKEVMNEVKKKYAWIDLLKPEGEPLFGTLLALDPSQIGKIGKIAELFAKMKYEEVTQVDQRLAIGPEQVLATPSDQPPSLDSLLGPNVLASMKSAGASLDQSGDEILLRLEQNRSLPAQTQFSADAPLGVGQYVWDRLTGWIRGVSQDEALRSALLDWIKDDKTFDPDKKDKDYQNITAKLGHDIDFVVTGHTHLARAINMGAGRFYFNSGTWIRLIGFTNDMLKDKASFKPFYDALMKGDMPAIDAAGLVMDKTCAVSIKQENGRTIGYLKQVTGDGTAEPAVLRSYPEV
ncbi:MAG TPA: metallophosphoesterase [Gallionella sp.]|nr:metallophosphoesterase [Gallionella sp.]